MPRPKVEREEGEIVDELDDLSDISSEEELLRQRLEVLEDYNHVLERKKAKRCTHGESGGKKRNISPDIFDLSTVATSHCHAYPRASKIKLPRNNIHNKRRKNSYVIHRTVKKPNVKVNKKPIVISESSDDSDIEYRNKRRKLSDAVSVTRNKTDSSLKARLMQMIHNSQNPLDNIGAKAPNTIIDKDLWIRIEASSTTPNAKVTTSTKSPVKKVQRSKVHEDAILLAENVTINKLEKCINDHEKLHNELSVAENKNKHLNIMKHDLFEIDKSNHFQEQTNVVENYSISENKQNDTVSIPNTENISNRRMSIDVVDGQVQSKNMQMSENVSDDDLELLREHALKSKTVKTQETDNVESKVESEPKPSLVSEDEDSDTEDLRLICLRSALIKKAIEMKQKQKIRKRLSQSTSLYDDIISNDLDDLASKSDKDNNTDIESVDMDIGSDGPESDVKEKRLIKDVTGNNCNSNDDFEEDEDLLRAKLLTSLSKNLPMLVDLAKMEAADNTKTKSLKDNKTPKSKIKDQLVNEEKRFIINTGGSDTEDEHEATKNLAKTHIKLSEHVDFQQKLDMFLKTTRMEVEKTSTPNLNEPAKPLIKTPQKFVPKAVTHLPKSEQIEYKKLVRRMEELVKLKQVRQQTMNIPKELIVQQNVVQQPRSVTICAKTHAFDLEEHIKTSRKKIAEESSRVMQLKEEGTKLVQKYKIVATELRNLSTAISLNKRQQKIRQAKLSQIRTEHQQLLRSSKTFNQTTKPSQTRSRPTKSSQMMKSTKSLSSETHMSELKAVTVSIVNDLNTKSDAKENVPTDLMVQLDIASNKKQVTVQDENSDDKSSSHEKDYRTGECPADYTSPLQALCSVGWSEDPNGVMCPFEVGGRCKDAHCKYLHPKLPASH